MSIKRKKAVIKPAARKKSSLKSRSTARVGVSSIKSLETNPILEPLGIKPYVLKKDELYMNTNQLCHFANILAMWKGQLMREVDRTIYDMQDVANYPDPIDRASQEEEFNLKLRERDRERKLLRKIDEVLANIKKEGNYGYCDGCGAEIGIRRSSTHRNAMYRMQNGSRNS